MIDKMTDLFWPVVAVIFGVLVVVICTQSLLGVTP
jgi:hypothetical protein